MEEKIDKLRQALTILQDINKEGLGSSIRQNVILGTIEKDLAILIVALEVCENYKVYK